MPPDTTAHVSQPMHAVDGAALKRRQSCEKIEKDVDYFLNEHKGFKYDYHQAHEDRHLPQAVFDFLCVVNTAKNGQLNEKELDEAMDIITMTKGDQEANCAELHYKHLPQAVKHVLETWDADKSGSVSASELVNAAEAQKKMKKENRLVKRLFGGAVCVVLILMFATFFLSYSAAEMAKDMRPDASGVQIAASGKAVSSAVSVQRASIENFADLEAEQLVRARSVQFVSKGVLHAYNVGSVLKNLATEEVTLGTSDGHQIVISLDKTVTLDGVAIDIKGSRRLQDGDFAGSLMTSGSFTMVAGGGF
jgi:hypothetical protein